MVYSRLKILWMPFYLLTIIALLVGLCYAQEVEVGCEVDGGLLRARATNPTANAVTVTAEYFAWDPGQTFDQGSQGQRWREIPAQPSPAWVYLDQPVNGWAIQFDKRYHMVRFWVNGVYLKDVFPISNATVGGFVLPVDKFGLLAPYIGLASTILAATAATAVYVKRIKHRKEG